MVEFRAIDVARRAEADAVLASVPARDDGDGNPAGVLHELDRLAAEPARAAPHEDDIVLLDSVAGPAEQHPLRGRADEGGRRGRLPGQMIGLREHLVLLGDGELPERAVVVVVVVAPDAGRGGDHRVFAGHDPRVVVPPPAGMDDHLVADRHALDTLPDGVDDSRGVAPAEMEVVRVAGALSLWRSRRPGCRLPPRRC